MTSYMTMAFQIARSIFQNTPSAKEKEVKELVKEDVKVEAKEDVNDSIKEEEQEHL